MAPLFLRMVIKQTWPIVNKPAENKSLLSFYRLWMFGKAFKMKSMYVLLNDTLSEHRIKLIVVLKHEPTIRILLLGSTRISMNILMRSAAWGPIICVLSSGRDKLSTTLQTCFKNTSLWAIFTTKSKISRHFSCFKTTSGTSYVIKVKDFKADNWT